MLNLGNITFGLAADSSGLRNAQNALQKFGSEVSAAMRNTKGDIDSTTKALIAQEAQAVKSLQNVQNMIASINRTKIAPEAKTDAIRQLEEAYTKYQSAINQTGGRKLNELGASRVNLGFQEQIDAVKRQVEAEKIVAEQVAATNAQWDRQSIAIQRAESQLTLFQDKVERAQRQGNLTPAQATAFNASATTAVEQYKSALGNASLSSKEFSEAQIKLRESLSLTTASFREATSTTHPFVQGISNLTNMMQLANGPFGQLGFGLQQTKQLMEENGVATGALLAGFAGLAIGAGSVVGALTRVTIEYERVVQVQNAVNGNLNAGSAQFEFLVQVANQAGISISALTPSFNRFISSAVGAGTSLHEADQQIKNLAVTFGVMHLSSQDAANALKAFDEIMSRGYVTSRDLVTRLSNDFPGAMAIAKLATGSTGAKLHEMLQSGQVDGIAFVKAFQNAAAQLYHIDLSAPVNTLQASIARLGNNWDVFLINISKAVGASSAFKDVLNSLNNVVIYLTSHVVQVLSVIAGLIGAMMGFAAAQIAIATVTGLTEAIMSLDVIIGAATTAYELFTLAIKEGTVATLLFDGAMLANPIGAVAVAITTLIGIIWGAKAAYDAINSSLHQYNSQIVDISAMDAYIAKVKEQKVQIDELTDSYLRNTQAQATNADALLTSQFKQLRDAQEHLKMVQYMQKENGPQFVGGSDIVKEAQARVEGLQRQVDAGVAAGLKLQKDIADLQDIKVTVPSDTHLGKGDTKPVKEKDTQGIAGLDEMLAKAKDFGNIMANLFKGPQNSELQAAFEKVNAQIEAISGTADNDVKKQIATAKQLGVAWSDVSSRMKELATTNVLATDATKDFNKIWEDVHKGQAEIAGINAQMHELMHNFGSDNAVKGLGEAAKQAQEELAKLSSGGLANIIDTINRSDMNGADKAMAVAHAKEAQAAEINAVIGLMKQEGYIVKDLNGSYDAAVSVMTKYFKTLDDAKTKLAEYQKIQQSAKALGTEAQNTASNLDYLKNGGNLGGLQVRQNQESADAMFRSVGQAGSAASQAYAALLTKQQDLTAALKVQTDILNGQIRSWQQFGTNAVNAFEGVILGTTKLKTALNTVLKDFITTMANAAFFDPLKANLSSAIQQAMTGKGFGGFSLGNLLSGSTVNPGQVANTTALASVNASILLLNTTILEQIAVQTSNGAFSSVTDAMASVGPLSILGYANGGLNGQISGPGTGTSDSILTALSNGEYVVNAAATSKFLPILEAINSGKITHRAAGGMVGTGDLYGSTYSSAAQVGQLSSQASHSIIDASTTLHVNGNMDSVTLKELKQHLDMRDAKMKSQLPLLVDGRVQDSLTRNRYSPARR